MKEELTFEDLISDLKENGVQSSVKGGYKFTEMLHEESQKLMKIGTSSSHLEIPAKVSNLFTDFIKKCVVYEDNMLDVVEHITVDTKPLLLNELRRITLGSVYVDDEEVAMPVKEYELLLFLAENPNIVFSKERLFDRIWGMDALGDVSTVTVHIQRIRDKIDKNRSDNNYIETVWGAGYRFRI